ncbi:Fur family transcriptional regulator [Dapis sp. BLCC M229]|uniref:Fur family transcriptional regulator n=1 Tax=Dapis sp. BLCC M229 TaxID=3400188 RepID=UPI003CF9039D
MKNNYTTTEIQRKMQSKGLRITPQRFAVYANLLSRSDHPSVEEILSEVNRELPISSKATIYSALTVLREVGLVKEVLLEEGVTRYDANVKPHHHFCCQNCSAIIDIKWETFSNIRLDQLPPGLDAESYEVIVKGKCDREDCQPLLRKQNSKVKSIRPKT